mmetsp:Transcript_5922/g.11213  ORF Transcript_5922/g.11213 Transcript_5922/m.11213 type:complete len:275 (-) Transcript_5922:217-1041(-)|eukprot:CAMPEP_0182458590 /NCGR_PEP_ID=MMETSP1319-20130603/3888_1 /TAXON_ID=172717 /ORGANISM="Bolidomonas pacifica, Strain RCC208" /LENGTH=274 /DNA_ID=CAMNT_0024657305 /DNA_START=231 /DNA_END=1055 /DNA_ORIENTATION=-
MEMSRPKPKASSTLSEPLLQTRSSSPTLPSLRRRYEEEVSRQPSQPTVPPPMATHVNVPVAHGVAVSDLDLSLSSFPNGPPSEDRPPRAKLLDFRAGAGRRAPPGGYDPVITGKVDYAPFEMTSSSAPNHTPYSDYAPSSGELYTDERSAPSLAAANRLAHQSEQIERRDEEEAQRLARISQERDKHETIVARRIAREKDKKDGEAVRDPDADAVRMYAAGLERRRMEEQRELDRREEERRREEEALFGGGGGYETKEYEVKEYETSEYKSIYD